MKKQCAHLSRRGPVLTRTVELDELAEVRRRARRAREVLPLLDQDREAASVDRELPSVRSARVPSVSSPRLAPREMRSLR